MTLFRRFLSMGALFFWQGGFTFYTLVVIPLTRHVLRDHGELPLAAQITGPVTTWLNAAGVVAVVVLLWDLTATADACRRRRRLRGGAWGVLAVTVAALFVVHSLLDRLGPLDGLAPADQRTFWATHTAYLATCTLQWAAGLAYLGLTLCAWRAQDGGGMVGRERKE